MRRFLRLASVIAIIALLPATAGAQTGELEDRLGDTRDEREQIAEELRDTRALEGDARERLSQVDAKLDRAQEVLAELQDELDVTEAERDAALLGADRARERLREVNHELRLTEDEYAQTRMRLHVRVRSAYMYGQVSFADTFAGVRDITDFLNTSTYVSHVLDGDRYLVERVEVLLHEVEIKRAEAQSLRVEAEREAAKAAAATAAAERATAEQQRLTEQIREQREERAAMLEELRSDRAAMEGHLAGLEAESARIESQLAAIAKQQEEERRRAEEAARRAEQERQAQQASDACADARAGGNDEAVRAACGSDDPIPSPNAGSWTRPTAGHVTSPFGPRWGRNHNGVDLAGGVGANVVAARGGTVVSVVQACHPTSSWGCGGGFGNYLTVAHPGGMATIYAHLSSVAVGVGQNVEAGQSVGSIGNSGNSYGPHLHFEMREAGTPRDPCDFISC